jgi:hypothetical protein
MPVFASPVDRRGREWPGEGERRSIRAVALGRMPSNDGCPIDTLIVNIVRRPRHPSAGPFVGHALHYRGRALLGGTSAVARQMALSLQGFRWACPACPNGTTTGRLPGWTATHGSPSGSPRRERRLEPLAATKSRPPPGQARRKRRASFDVPPGTDNLAFSVPFTQACG